MSLRKLVGISVFATLAVLLDQKPGQAWFNICNRTPDKLSVAFGYHDINDNRDAPDDKGWVAQGWWNLNPNECAQVYPPELWRRNQYYYFFAYSQGRKRVWSGNNGFCVQQSGFTLYQTEYVRNNCTSIDRGKWEKFKQVDIGGGYVQNYTLTLE